jgi:manganese/zinc/iron transport system permease protein
MITIDKNIISLTNKGKNFTDKAIDYIITNDHSKIESIKEDFFLFRG